MWCRPEPSSVSPIYMPGALRTASRPFSTLMESAPYSAIAPASVSENIGHSGSDLPGFRTSRFICESQREIASRTIENLSNCSKSRREDRGRDGFHPRPYQKCGFFQNIFQCPKSSPPTVRDLHASNGWRRQCDRAEGRTYRARLSDLKDALSGRVRRPRPRSR